MELYEICTEIAEIEEGLCCGGINFEYDNLMCAMKPGHPSEILDEILSTIGWDVSEGRTPEKDTLEKTLKDLKGFQETFKVEQLSEPIKHLEKYISGLM